MPINIIAKSTVNGMLYTRESFPVPVQTINKTPIDEWKGQGSSMVIYVDHQQKA